MFLDRGRYDQHCDVIIWLLSKLVWEVKWTKLIMFGICCMNKNSFLLFYYTYMWPLGYEIPVIYLIQFLVINVLGTDLLL